MRHFVAGYKRGLADVQAETESLGEEHSDQAPPAASPIPQASRSEEPASGSPTDAGPQRGPETPSTDAPNLKIEKSDS